MAKDSILRFRSVMKLIMINEHFIIG